MTSAELARVLLRRWYLVVVGAAISLGVLWAGVHQPPVFFTQLDVVLLPPGDARAVNTLREGPYALAPLAGLVVSDVNDGVRVTEMGSATTTLYGEGVRDGERVRLRNRGTQWQRVYDAGVIDVQVAGSDPDSVRARARSLVEELENALMVRQRAEGVRATSMASLQSSPADPVVQQIGPSTSRVAVSTALLGSTLTFIGVAGFDRLIARRRRPVGVGDRRPSTSLEVMMS